ncbi:MAG: ATP-binding protein [Desulfopila sp.]
MKAYTMEHESTESGTTPSAGNFTTADLPAGNILDQIGIPCFLLDRDSLFLGGNREFYRFCGGCSGDYLGRDIYELLVRPPGDEMRAVDDRLLAREEVLTQRAEIVVLKTGAIRPVNLKKTAFCNEAGDRIGVLVSIVDIAEMVEVENALQVSESEKEALLEGFPGIVCLFDTRARAVWANGKLQTLFAEPVGKKCNEIFCRAEKNCLACAIPKSLASGKVQSTVRPLQIRTATGEEHFYEMVSSPIRNVDDKVVAAMVIGRDLSDTMRLEKQLRHSQKMEAIGTLAGGIAHDFNNILTPIIGYAEILRLKMQKSLEDNKDNLEFTENILKAGKRAKSLVEQLLTFSRSTENKATPQLIQPIVKEVMKLMRVTLPSTIAIREDIDEGCGMVSIDPVLIHQVLINLCTNSAHAMSRQHGTLSVTLAAKGRDELGKEWLRLSVIDTGCGIPPALLDRIFEPYFTTKEKSRGTGMGLAMVHGIITRMGGRIEVNSVPGEGTTFALYLPVTGPSPSLDQIVSLSDMPRGSGRILLVDDEAQVVQVTGELLTSLGYEVTGRTSPLVALALLRTNPGGFDLVLTDLTMPELTGLELSRQLKEIRDDLPVILFTGYTDTVSEHESQEAGIIGHCMKPVSLRELADLVFSTLRHTG